MDDQKSKIAIGLDIGTDNIRIVVGSRTDDEINILEVHEAPSYGITKGRIDDINAATKAVDSALSHVDRTLGMQIESATVNIDGANIVSKRISDVIAITGQDKIISEDDLRRIEEKATTEEEGLYSNYETLDFIPHKYIIDEKTPVKNPLDMKAFNLKVEADMISVIKEDYNNLNKVLEGSNLYDNQIIAAPIIATDLVLTQKQKENGVLLIDFGSHTTTMAIYKDGDLQYASVIPKGSNDMTNDLAIGLTVEPEMAEVAKKECADCLFNGGDRRMPIKYNGEKEMIPLHKVDIVVEAFLDQIFDEISKRLRKTKYEYKLPNGIVLTGGGAKLKNLPKYVQDKMGLFTKLANTDYGFNGQSKKIDDLSYVTATGLMLIDLESIEGGQKSVQQKAKKSLFGKLFKK